MNSDRLNRYVEQSQELIENTPQMDEQNTKRKLVEPLLEVLGWDILTSNVELEYSIQIGSSPTKVDYALQIEDAPVVLVEAKGLDTPLSSSHRDQLKSYIRQTGVDWGLLTNGEEFEVYKRKTKGSRPDEVELGSFSLEELPQNKNTIQTLSRDLIETGEAKSIAERIEAERLAARKLRDKKGEIAEQITDFVTEEVGSAVSQTVEDGAKQFVDVLAKSLEQEAEGQLPIEPQRETNQSTTIQSEWEPERGANAIAGTIPKKDIEGEPSALVALFPTKKSGVQFLKENNAWGFVRVGREPEFVAMYVSEDVQQIRYIAQVKEIVDAEEADLARDLESYSEPQSAEDQAGFDVEKQVIVFEPGSLLELEDPIELGSKWPQGLTYTTLGDIRTATKTHEAF